MNDVNATVGMENFKDVDKKETFVTNLSTSRSPRSTRMPVRDPAKDLVTDMSRCCWWG